MEQKLQVFRNILELNTESETDEEFVKRVILRPDSSTGELNYCLSIS